MCSLCGISRESDGERGTNPRVWRNSSRILFHAQTKSRHGQNQRNQKRTKESEVRCSHIQKYCSLHQCINIFYLSKLDIIKYKATSSNLNLTIIFAFNETICRNLLLQKTFPWLRVVENVFFTLLEIFFWTSTFARNCRYFVEHHLIICWAFFFFFFFFVCPL